MSAETKLALDNISQSLNTEKETVTRILASTKQRVNDAISNIALLPTTFELEIAEINGYAPDNIHEENHKADLAVYAVQFSELTTILNTIKTKLETITEL